MEEILSAIPTAVGSLTFIVLGPLFWWKADDLISKQGREALAGAISGRATSGDRNGLRGLAESLDRSLPWRSDVATYLLHILIISALSLVAVGLIYCTKTGGFWIQFQADPMVRNNFMAQLLFDGILKVSIVNAIGLLPHSLYIRRIQTARLAESFGYIVMDVLSRELLFLGISLMIWLCFVPFRAFTGNANLAIRALLPTFVGHLLDRARSTG